MDHSYLRGAILGGALLAVPLSVMAVDKVYDSKVGELVVALLGTDGVLAESVAEEALPASHIIVVTPAMLSTEGLQVELQEGRFKRADLRGQLVSPLFETLHETRSNNVGLAKLTAGAYREDEVVLVVDAEVPFETLRAVMYTAAQAEYSRFIYAVRSPWMGPRGIATDVPRIGPPRPLDDVPDHPPLNLSVVVGKQGFVVSSLRGTHELPCAGACNADSYDWAGLNAKLGEIKEQHPEDMQIILVPETDVPMQVIVRTLDVARWAPLVPLTADEATWSAWGAGRRDLFDLPIIAGGSR